MYCEQCGKMVEQGLKFCTNCGHPVSNRPDALDKSESFSGTSSSNAGIKKFENYKMPLIIGGVIVALLLISGVVACVVFGGSSDPATKDGSYGVSSENGEADGYASLSHQDLFTSSGEADTVSIGVVPESAFEDYSWGEIAQIAHAIEACDDRSEGEKIAVAYHLMKSSGKMADSCKRVDFEGYGTVDVRLVDIRHDDLSSGGKAGMTFVAEDLLFSSEMNLSPTNKGGWKESYLREELNSYVLDSVEEDLRYEIARVEKRTNNKGGNSIKSSSVTVTDDYLWVPSWKEILGNPTFCSRSFNKVFNNEGWQYQYYKDHHVHGEQKSAKGGLMNKSTLDGSTVRWWIRTPALGTSDNFGDWDVSSVADEGGDATSQAGVVVCFCI